MKKGKEEACCKAYNHETCMGAILIIVGALAILNDLYSVVTWSVFVGIILALLGLTKIIMGTFYNR